ncbi:hypothetical protein NPIL_123731 [Nephila pilipes]|uniref:Uncharacterized protein n=1 Tax=Nephila pilipes TaxID=299642 RepID=A0A8X6R477_NEPPI|nr:hypothetical protein NPIL_123731 [Nephila pilipes]
MEGGQNGTVRQSAGRIKVHINLERGNKKKRTKSENKNGVVGVTQTSLFYQPIMEGYIQKAIRKFFSKQFDEGQGVMETTERGTKENMPQLTRTRRKRWNRRRVQNIKGS